VVGMDMFNADSEGSDTGGGSFVMEEILSMDGSIECCVGEVDRDTG
jgi:hypothetical protein